MVAINECSIIYAKVLDGGIVFHFVQQVLPSTSSDVTVVLNSRGFLGFGFGGSSLTSENNTLLIERLLKMVTM